MSDERAALDARDEARIDAYGIQRPPPLLSDAELAEWVEIFTVATSEHDAVEYDLTILSALLELTDLRAATGRVSELTRELVRAENGEVHWGRTAEALNARIDAALALHAEPHYCGGPDFGCRIWYTRGVPCPTFAALVGPVEPQEATE